MNRIFYGNREAALADIERPGVLAELSAMVAGKSTRERSDILVDRYGYNAASEVSKAIHEFAGTHAPGERRFIDTLTATGALYLIPASRRMEWHDYDIACEASHDPGPVPPWAKPIGELSHVEFENALEVM